MFQHRFDEQIEFFSNYLRLYPSDCAAYTARATAYWYKVQLEDAVRDYSRALELNPNDMLARSGRGQVLAELGENTRALEDLDIVLSNLETTPKVENVQWCRELESFVRRGRAVVFAGLGRTTDAFTEFDQSIALNPDNAWVYFSRARIYDRQDDRQSALSEYTQAMAKDNPPLSLIQREHAQKRIASLSGQQAPN